MIAVVLYFHFDLLASKVNGLLRPIAVDTYACGLLPMEKRKQATIREAIVYCSVPHKLKGCVVEGKNYLNKDIEIFYPL